jgi:hypothetical protein
MDVSTYEIKKLCQKQRYIKRVRALEKHKKTDKGQERTDQKEKLPVLGYIGVIDLFMLFCGVLTILFALHSIFSQAVLFLFLSFLFFFSRKRLEQVYPQPTLLSINALSSYLALGLAPILLLTIRLQAANPESLLIFPPVLICFFSITISQSRTVKKISLGAFTVLCIVLYFLFVSGLLNYTWANIIFCLIGLIMFL